MALLQLLHLKQLLNSESSISNDLYYELLARLPAGLASRLRLVPDLQLSAKLSHLHCALSFMENIPDLQFEYNVISIEGISDEIFLFDHDVIVENAETKKRAIVDCTSNARLSDSKLEKLVSIISSNELDAIPIVHVFKPKHFSVDIEKPNDFTDSNDHVFSFLDKVSLMQSYERNRFFDCCASVYERVVTTSLSSCRSNLDEKYITWDDSEETISNAINIVRNHSQVDDVIFSSVAHASNAQIYYDTFKKILSQQRSIREPFLVGPSALNVHRELAKVLEELSDNPICKVLHAALISVNGWCGLTLSDNINYDMMFKSEDCKRGILPVNSKYKVVAKHHKQHTFYIYLSEDVIDRNYLEQILGVTRVKENTRKFTTDCDKYYSELCSEYSRLKSIFSAKSSVVLNNSILGKISDVSNIYMYDHDNISGAAASMLYHAAIRSNGMIVGALINHQYEIAKTFTASLKVPPKNNLYYVGVNGPFASLSIIRMASTQDSFTAASYFVIYKSVVNHLKSAVRDHFVIHDKIVQTKTRTLNRNTVAHYLRLPYAFLSLVTWEIEHVQDNARTLDGSIVNDIIINSALHLAVNSDQFAQAAEQIRYLFTSNVGLGATPAAICDKISFIRPSTAWELIYLFRMLKLACGLNVIYKNKRIGSIMHDREFSIMFPNSVKPSSSFSHLISNEEEDIYRLALKVNREFVHGRFQCSLMFIIGATLSNVNTDAVDIGSLYTKLNNSPIEACTMRGGMERGVATKEPQGIRAASVMIEELIEEMGGNIRYINKDRLNASIFLDDLEEFDFDFSILSAVLRQFKKHGDYRYRIVQKDQKGHREISVLNAKFRLGALFTEKIAYELSNLVSTDVLDDKHKDSILESSVRKILKEPDVSLAISDNSDQKRWGPNHLLHTFSAMYLALLKNDMGLFRTANLVFQYGENKMAKFPEKLIKLLSDEKYNPASEPIAKFKSFHLSDMRKDIYERKFEWGMCQGIFHRTSSLFHGIMCNVVESVLKNDATIPEFDMSSFVTSDDAERLIVFKGDIKDRIQLCKKIHSVIINVGSVMNILRNESKSVFSTHITEFNSIFYHNGILATPTLKQRISKIDIGDGHDHINDYLTALSLPMGYLQNGGSYSGAVIISILNIALHTEQWRRWSIIEKKQYNRPVEFGGFPAIEPFGTMISGPISSFFMRASSYSDVDSYAEYLSETSLVPAMEVSMKEFQRTEYGAMEDKGMFVLKTANPVGIVSTSRTDKRLSQFERRHKMSHWKSRDKFITLNSGDCAAGKFIFNVGKITRTCKFESIVGTNSFYVRFSDPWINADRACLKYNPQSFYVRNFLKVVDPKAVSYNDYITKALSASELDIKKFFDDCMKIGISRGHTTTLVSKIKDILNDAQSVRDTLLQTPDITLQEVQSKNSIVKVNLSTGTSVDSDVFFHTLLKNIVGKKVENALILATRDLDIWDKLENMPLEEKSDAIEGLYFCDNVIVAHTKFVRTSTKLICPGELRPTSLPDLLDIYLSSKYTEKFGIMHSKFPVLQSSKFHMTAFSASNNRLIERSLKYMEEKESHINVHSNERPKRFGIISDSSIITDYDSYYIDNDHHDVKLVQINSKNKYSFLQKGKLWIGARVQFLLSAATMKALLRSELTHYHEYAISSTAFTKNQTRLVMDVVVNGKTCFEIQMSKVEGDSTFYSHHFFVNTNSYFITAKSSIMDTSAAKPWSAKVSRFINDKMKFRTNTEYIIPPSFRGGKSTDSVTFHTMKDDDTFDLVDYPCNLSIFLKHSRSGVIIPICSVQNNIVQEVDLGFEYNYSQFEEALHAFTYLDEFIRSDVATPNHIQDYLRLLLFRTSAFTPVSFLNNVAEKRRVDIKLSSLESAEFLRSFLFCNLVKDIKSSRGRMQHYFLNLFRSSPFYNNGITSIKFDEKLLKDEDMTADFITAEESETIDISIPEVPAWIEKDRVYNDILSQPIISTADSVRHTPMNIDYLLNMECGSDEDEWVDLELPLPHQIMKTNNDDIIDYSDIAARLAEDSTIPKIRLPQVTAGVETIDVAVVNRLHEDCISLIKYLKSKAQLIKINQVSKYRMFGDRSTFYGSIQMFSTKVLDCLEIAKPVFDSCFGQDAEMFKLKVPISAICMAELNF